MESEYQATLIENPVGLSRHIQEIQMALAEGLPWLEESYGIAETGASYNGAAQLLPEIYLGEGKYLPVTPNENITASSFFKKEGGQIYDPQEYTPYRQNSVTQNMACIVFAHLPNIKDKMQYSYMHRFKDELQYDIMRVLKQQDIVIRRVSDNTRDVLEDYTYEKVNPQTFRHPFAGFKISFTIGFMEHCIPGLVTEPTIGPNVYTRKFKRTF